MKDQSIAKSYAKALNNAINDVNKVNLIKEQLAMFKEVFLGVSRIKDYMGCPEVNLQEKKLLADDVCEKLKMDVAGRNFIKLLIKNERIFLLPEIIVELEKILLHCQGMEKVIVVSVSKLNESEIKKIRNILEIKTGKKIKLKFEEDESIIGGTIIKIGDKLFDGSIKTQLENIKKEMCLKGII